MRLANILLDFKIILTLVFLYRYTFYALLNDTFGEQVGMLYINTDSFFVHWFVKDRAKERNARPQLIDAFNYSKIIYGHFSHLVFGNDNLHA